MPLSLIRSYSEHSRKKGNFYLVTAFLSNAFKRIFTKSRQLFSEKLAFFTKGHLSTKTTQYNSKWFFPQD